MLKRIVEEAVVGGLTGLGVVLVYIIVRAHLEGAEPGDWLQFAGALLGAAAAVAGALFVEDVRRRHTEMQGQASVGEALAELAHAFEAAGAPLEGDLGQQVSAINARRYLLEVAKEFTDFVLRQQMQPKSEVWRRAHGYGHHIDRILKVSWSEHDPHVGEDLCTEDTVNRWSSAVTRITDSILPIVAADLSAAQNVTTIRQS